MSFLSRLNFKLTERDIFLIAAAGTIGFLTPLLPLNFAILWGLIPLFALEASSRTAAFLVSFVFPLTLARGLIISVHVFFRDEDYVRSTCLWFFSAAMFALPTLLCWPSHSNKPTLKALKTFLMLALPLVPPLALVSAASPFAAAGLLFPGLGWYGLVLSILLYVLAAISRRVRMSFAVTMLIICVLRYASPLELHTNLRTDFFPTTNPALEEVGNIQGIDLSLSNLGSGSTNTEAQYLRERFVFLELMTQNYMGNFTAPIIVLPETVAGQLDEAAFERWRRFFAELAPEKIFIIGAEIPRGSMYNNVLVAFNAPGEPIATQRIPPPFSMYRPFTSTGATASIFSLGSEAILNLNGQKVGVLICYEHFLSWPFLSIMTQYPDVLLATSNLWWCRDSSLPHIRNLMLAAFTALFDIPLISSVNM